MTILLAILSMLTLVFGVAWVVTARKRGRLEAQIKLGQEAHIANERSLQEMRTRCTLAEQRHTEMQRLQERLQTERIDLAQRLSRAEAERDNLHAKIAEGEAERERQANEMRLQFQALSTKILGEQTAQFKDSSKEQLDHLLQPFSKEMEEFKKRIEELSAQQNTQQGAFNAQFNQLMELNRTISTDAQNLTDALKGSSKMQGDWGEMFLETILEQSALQRGIHYQVQYSTKGEEGRELRPDFVISMPEGRHLVIDSKVTLKAYTNYSDAKSEEERQQHLKLLVESLRNHIKGLSSKEYQTLFNSPDFVILFVPIEPAYLAALRYDNNLWGEAYQRKVIISSPTSLFGLMRIVSDLWRHNDQEKNTKRIAELALKLYEQLVSITSSVANAGASLKKAQESYDDAIKRLTSGNNNVITLGKRLQQAAHLESKKQLPTSFVEMADTESDPAVTVELLEEQTDSAEE